MAVAARNAPFAHAKGAGTGWVMGNYFQKTLHPLIFSDIIEGFALQKA